MKIRPVGAELFHADGPTDMTQLIVAFRNFANAPKNWKKLCNVDRRVNAKNGRWLVNQHWPRWRGLGDTQRQARELISGPSLGAKAKFLSFNRTQSRAVTGLLTGHNTLRRHLHLLGLVDSPLCRKCGVKEENSAHILCEFEALASFRHVHLGSFFLEPEDVKTRNLGANWNFSKVTGLP
jgi:hypothetical protein